MMIRKLFFISCVFLISFNSFAQKTWQELLAEYGSIMQPEEREFITRQYECFVQGNSPTIVSPEIKEIPIHEEGEALFNLRAVSLKRLTMLPDAPTVHPFSAPTCNSGFKNASKMRLDVYLRLTNMVVQLDKLANHFGYKEETLIIKVFEGLRDLRTQQMLFENKRDQLRAQNPYLRTYVTQGELDELEKETAKWVSPVKDNVPVHSTGAAVDIRLWDEEKNDFMDVGKFGVIWGDNPTAPTFSESITEEQKKNRLYRLMAAYRAGLVNYSWEHWHFSAGDRYAAYWLEKDPAKRCAIYGPITD